MERLREPREGRQKEWAKCALLSARRGDICAAGCWRGDDKPSLEMGRFRRAYARVRDVRVFEVGDPAAR